MSEPFKDHNILDENLIPSPQVSLICAAKVMALLGEVPWYTARAALEICQSLQRENESKSASLLGSQYLQRLSEETRPSYPDVSRLQAERSSAA